MLTDDQIADFLVHPADTLDALDRIECEESLLSFVRRMWSILEPANPMIEGWAMEAICEHLQAVTDGHIQKLAINVPPGFSKSLITNVFWPAYEWGPRGMPHMRYVSFSYTSILTQRDNRRFRDVLMSHDYGRLFGNQFSLTKAGEQLVQNDRTGWKLATSIGGVGTGERGDRVVLDDANNVKDSESDPIRDETNRWIREGMSNRLNDPARSAIVSIQQRTHEQDATGTILSEMAGEFEHLLIPMEWEGRRQISTVTGLKYSNDPRKEVGDLAWPERFPAKTVRGIKITVGPFAWAGQYQQSPTPRGGGIFKRDWWQLWDPVPDATGAMRFPQCEFIVASLDGAFGQKQENDYSALTIWGVFRDTQNAPVVPTAYLEQTLGGVRNRVPDRIVQQKFGRPRVILMNAWQKRLPLHGPEIEREPGETEAQYMRRSMQHWGVVEWVAYSCKRFRIDTLLVEAKANGIDVANEIRRQHAGDGYGVQLIDPGRLDKVARAYSVQHLFADAMIYAPDREWADEVITQMSVFPKSAHDDLCLVGETMIATKRGNIPLRDVRAGDMALTPDGWRKVTAAGATGIKPVIEVAGLVGTDNHPVFTFDRGYVRMDSVTQAQPDLARPTACGFLRTALLRSSSSMASPIDGWEESVGITYRSPRPMKGVGTLKGFMSLFGRNIMAGQYRKAMRFITETATRSIASLTIWSAYRKACIAQCLSALIARSADSISRIFVRLPQTGIAAQRGASGTVAMPPNPSASPVLSPSGYLFGEPSLASGVALSSRAEAQESGSADRRANPKSQATGLASTPSSIPTMRLVFNMTVEGAHCYYANGVLVHNCDSATQALKFLRDIGLASHGHELDRDFAALLEHKSAAQPLYDV